MNIFALDNCPRNSAIWQHDKHVVKMILETAQMLSTNSRIVPEIMGIDIPEFKPYEISFTNHPCTVWARQHPANFMWLIEHGHWLWKEYDYRYGGVHKAYSRVIKPLRDFWQDKLDYTSLDRRPFATAMPDVYKVEGDAVQSYRNYYVSEKVQQSGWTKRGDELPDWLLSEIY